MNREGSTFFYSRENRIREAKKLTLLSDAFMAVVLSDRLACQHVLRILTGDHGLVVKSVRTQYALTKWISHGARLDVLAETEKGALYNLEIQRSDTVDHARRVRFYEAMVDSESLEKGKNYGSLAEVHLIYISETDIWKHGRTVYPVKRELGETGVPYQDGLHTLYVNAQIDDGSEIAALMRYFKTADPEDFSQGDLSRRVHFLKCEEGGYDIMCEITERWRQEDLREGRREGKREVAVNLAAMGMAVEKIALAVNENVPLVQQWLKSGTVLPQKGM